jgi:plastocyanin domain-containing protein
MNLRTGWTLALALVIASLFAAGCQKKEPRTVHAPPGNQDVPIQVTEQGFDPARIEVTKGTNATLVFTRITDNTCAKEVVIAGNGARLKLPLNQPVRIGLGTVNTRIPFACGENMLKGEVIASAQ